MPPTCSPSCESAAWHPPHFIQFIHSQRSDQYLMHYVMRVLSNRKGTPSSIQIGRCTVLSMAFRRVWFSPKLRLNQVCQDRLEGWHASDVCSSS